MRSEDGFSVVELMVTLMITGVVALMLLNFLDQTTSVTNRAANDVETERAAQTALRTITEDLRAATGIQPCPSGDYRTCLSFKIPGSAAKAGVTTCPEYQDTYALVGTTVQLTRTKYPANCATPTAGGPVPILLNVKNPASSPVFTYYDKSQNPIDPVNAAATIPSTAYILVTLNLSYRGGQSTVLNLSSTAALRNNR